MSKYFTKQVHDGLDSFVANGQPAQFSPEFTSNEYTNTNTKKLNSYGQKIKHVSS